MPERAPSIPAGRPCDGRTTMKNQALLLILFAATIAACGDTVDQPMLQAEPAAGLMRMQDKAQGEMLAYEHSIAVDVAEDKLDAAFESVRQACAADRANNCTLLWSEASHGDWARANFRIRVEPDGVEPLVSLASGAGEVIRRSTHIEDLAKTITDLDKRVSILTTTRDRLIELEQRGMDDVESLITLTTELTRIQSELEEIAGQRAYQQQRVDTQILNIEFVVERQVSFWRPITRALSSFGQTLSRGIGDAISAIAYLLPWAVLLFVVVYLLRLLWRFVRGR